MHLPCTEWAWIPMFPLLAATVWPAEILLERKPSKHWSSGPKVMQGPQNPIQSPRRDHFWECHCRTCSEHCYTMYVYAKHCLTCSANFGTTDQGSVPHALPLGYQTGLYDTGVFTPLCRLTSTSKDWLRRYTRAICQFRGNTQATTMAAANPLRAQGNLCGLHNSHEELQSTVCHAGEGPACHNANYIKKLCVSVCGHVNVYYGKCSLDKCTFCLIYYKITFGPRALSLTHTVWYR